MMVQMFLIISLTFLSMIFYIMYRSEREMSKMYEAESTKYFMKWLELARKHKELQHE